jgi:hypothetical protein
MNVKVWLLVIIKLKKEKNQRGMVANGGVIKGMLECDQHPSPLAAIQTR